MPSSILDRAQRECSCGLHAALAPRSSHGATCGRFVGSHSAQIATARTHEWSSPDATAASCSRPRWAASADLLALYFRRWGATCLACANAGSRQARTGPQTARPRFPFAGKEPHRPERRDGSVVQTSTLDGRRRKLCFGAEAVLSRLGPETSPSPPRQTSRALAWDSSASWDSATTAATATWMHRDQPTSVRGCWWSDRDWGARGHEGLGEHVPGVPRGTPTLALRRWRHRGAERADLRRHGPGSLGIRTGGDERLRRTRSPC